MAHNHVLPRATAAIHHGGAGTVHAVARAGIPAIVVPFIGDQPFWGNVLHRSGLAPEPIPYRKLTVDRLWPADYEGRPRRRMGCCGEESYRGSAGRVLRTWRLLPVEWRQVSREVWSAQYSSTLRSDPS